MDAGTSLHAERRSAQRKHHAFSELTHTPQAGPHVPPSQVARNRPASPPKPCTPPDLKKILNEILRLCAGLNQLWLMQPPIDGRGPFRFHVGMKPLLSLAAAMLLAASATTAEAGTLEDIRARGTITCGVPAKAVGIAETVAGKRGGVAIELCSVLAAAVLGNAAATAYVEVGEGDAIVALQAEEADVLLVPGPWRLAMEVDDGVLLTAPLLRRTRDGAVLGPVIRQGDDSWLVAVRWVLEAMRAGAAGVPMEGQQTAVTGLGLASEWPKLIDGVSGGYEPFWARHMKALEADGWTRLPPGVGMQF